MQRLSDIAPDAGLVLCPCCGKNVNPYIRQKVPGMPNARLPIPDRLIVVCPVSHQDWYMVDPS